MKIQAKIRNSFAFIALFAALAFAPAAALAGTCTCGSTATQTTCNSASDCGATCGSQTPSCSGGSTGASTDTSGSSSASSSGGLENPMSAICGTGKSAVTGQKCVQLIIGNIIRAALGISGSIALLMMTWGGFLWLTSMGNSERVDKGKSTLIWATLGLILIFGGYAITSFVIKAIATGGK